MKGYIYKITCHVTGYIYIGSTIKDIDWRLKRHIYAYNGWRRGNTGFLSSYVCLFNDDYVIDLIEEVTVETRRELISKEYEHMLRYSSDKLVNVCTQRYYNIDSKKYKKKVARGSERVECSCGAIVARKHIVVHRKSYKHRDYAILDQVYIPY